MCQALYLVQQGGDDMVNRIETSNPQTAENVVVEATRKHINQ